MYNVYQPAAFDAALFGIACSMKHWYYECFTVCTALCSKDNVDIERTTGFWNNHHQVRSTSKDGKAK